LQKLKWEKNRNRVGKDYYFWNPAQEPTLLDHFSPSSLAQLNCKSCTWKNI